MIWVAFPQDVAGGRPQQLRALADADVARFYALWASHPRVVTLYSQGVNQSAQGTDKVNAIINCHLLTGRIGKPGADAVVGTLSTTDPDAGNTFTYTLVSGTGSTDNGAFNISASVKAYYALKAIGDDPDAPHMVRARDAILAAIQQMLQPGSGAPRTPDLGGKGSTSDVGKAIAALI